MDKELQLILSHLNEVNERTEAGINLFTGRIGDHHITLAKCGIGKVNAAIRTFSLIQIFKPDLVLNSGVAGGAGLPIGSILIADKVAYDDVWCGPGTNFGEADGCPLFFLPSPQIIRLAQSLGDTLHNVYYGLMCSGDRFISTHEEVMFIRSHFPDVKAVDMESASIAQVCFMTNTPFNIIRVVSDTPGEGENIEQYRNFWQDAPVKTFEVVRKIIENLK